MNIPQELQHFKLVAQQDLSSAEDFLFKEFWRFASWMPFPLRTALDCIIPAKVKFTGFADLSTQPYWPAVLDQGDLGSCVDNAVATCLLWDAIQEGDKQAQLRSRLFLYWNARGGVPEDTGSTLRESLDGAQTYGACQEALWPYVTSQFAVKPPQAAWLSAQASKDSNYYRLLDLNDMRACLDQGYPFAICMGVSENLYALTSADYLLRVPESTQGFLGGHCVTVVGYDDTRRVFKVQNSWGKSWANKGFFEMTYELMADPIYVWDAWTVRTISAP